LTARQKSEEAIGRAGAVSDAASANGADERVGLLRYDRSQFEDLHVDTGRLLSRIEALAEEGAIADGGCARLALTDEDRAGRDLVVTWMRDLGLAVSVDAVGNVIAHFGDTELAPVMMGSHIDTVVTGGRYDGNLGVLAGLEVIETLIDAGITPLRPIEVAFFTNEEGSRFSPDMLGSLTYVGGMALEEALDTVGIDGANLGDELRRIGYAGLNPCPGPAPHAYVELHIEQGPVLESEGIEIGVVEGVQGISWQELTVEGQSNHAGTTPMGMRHDAGYAGAAVASFVRELALDMGARQVGTVGSLRLRPDLVNVVAAEARLTVDLRNTDEALLRGAEERLEVFLDQLSTDEGVAVRSRRLARFVPVTFDPRVVSLVESTAEHLGYSTLRLPSGAGHDAQMLARVCPSAMVFVPSVGGISHNPAEYTPPASVAAGSDVLLHVVLALAGSDDAEEARA
jgi:beta-ureidopropionase / N-carbamoyl-L-amino-acid hydrolase